MKRTTNKRLTLERERVRTLVVELSRAELRHAVGGNATNNGCFTLDDHCQSIRTTTAGTQN